LHGPPPSVVRKGGYVIEVQIHPEQPVHRVVLVSSFNASANEEDSPTLLVAFQTLHLTCNVDFIELPAPGALPPPAARLLCSPQPGVAMDSDDPVGGRLTGCQLTGVGSSGWPAHWVFLSIHGYASSMAGSGTGRERITVSRTVGPAQMLTSPCSLEGVRCYGCSWNAITCAHEGTLMGEGERASLG
jgi:hypothetical protein